MDQADTAHKDTAPKTRKIPERRTKLLIHLGMGGHTSQIVRLVDQIGDDYKNSAVAAKPRWRSSNVWSPKFSGLELSFMP